MEGEKPDLKGPLPLKSEGVVEAVVVVARGVVAVPGMEMERWVLESMARRLGVVVMVVVVMGVGVGTLPSTGFLERWRPRCMCRSQYFCSGTTSLEHRHFFPSVRRHLPGSGSMLLR